MTFQSWHEEFDEFWSEHLKVSEILILMGSLWTKYILLELKKYKGVTFHETEERYKIWRGIDLSFQKWHKEFDKFWPVHSKVSKMFTLIGSFWAKYILFELKKYRAVIFHKTEEGYKICRGINFSFQNWRKEFDKFWPDHSKVSNIFTLIVSFWAKYILFELKKYRGVIFHKIEEGYKIWRGKNLPFQNWHQGIWQVFTWALESLKNLCFNWLLVTKIYIAWATKLQRSYLSWHWKDMQILKKNWKVSKFGLWWDCFVQSKRNMTSKFAEELSVMKMKNNAKFEEELTCHFKTDMRNLTNFDLSTRKSKKVSL